MISPRCFIGFTSNVIAQRSAVRNVVIWTSGKKMSGTPTSKSTISRCSGLVMLCSKSPTVNCFESDDNSSLSGFEEYWARGE